MRSDFIETGKKIIRKPVFIHLVSAFIVFCIIVFLVLQGLTIYTRHNQVIAIPDVKGLQMEEARIFLENKGLRYRVIDSVYTNEVKPGAIFEIIPAIGSNVKKGRILFITINANTVQMAAIPDVIDQSYRQGEALITGRGFTSVTKQYVNGPYRDLIIGVELDGKRLKPGELVPLNANLTLKVGDGGWVENKDSTVNNE